MTYNLAVNIPIIICLLKTGVCHRIPYIALVRAVECYDPLDYGPLDDVEDVDEGEGDVVRVRKDWFRPPVEKRCPCQSGETPEPCNCGLGAKPQGYSTMLYWDKRNNERR